MLVLSSLRCLTNKHAYRHFLIYSIIHFIVKQYVVKVVAEMPRPALFDPRAREAALAMGSSGPEHVRFPRPGVFGSVYPCEHGKLVN